MVRYAPKEMAGHWDFAVSIYGLCHRPNLRDLTRYIRRTWKPRARFEIIPKYDDFFLVRFALLEDRDDALNNAPWMFDSQLLVVQKWEVGVKLTKFLLSTVPIWIRLSFFGYPWTRRSLAIVANAVGSYYDCDPRSVTDRCFFDARACVEVSADQKLPPEVMVEFPDGRAFEVKVTYEAVPEKCDKCVAFGHSTAKCPLASSSSAPAQARNSSTASSSPVGAKGERGRSRTKRGRRKSPVTMPHSDSCGDTTVKPVAAPRLGVELSNTSATADDTRAGVTEMESVMVDDSTANCVAVRDGKYVRESSVSSAKATAPLSLRTSHGSEPRTRPTSVPSAAALTSKDDHDGRVGRSLSRRGQWKTPPGVPHRSSAGKALAKAAPRFRVERVAKAAFSPATTTPLVPDSEADCLPGVGDKAAGESSGDAVKADTTAIPHSRDDHASRMAKTGFSVPCRRRRPVGAAALGSMCRAGLGDSARIVESPTVPSLGCSADMSRTAPGVLDFEFQDSTGSGLQLPDAMMLGPGWISAEAVCV